MGVKPGDRMKDPKTGKVYVVHSFPWKPRPLLLLFDEEVGEYEIGRPGNDIVERVVPLEVSA